MTLLNKREHLFTLHDLTIGSNLEHEQKHFTKQLKHQVNCSSRQKLNTLQLHDANVHVHNTGKQIWDTSSQSIMPILAIAHALKHLKTCSGYFLTHIYIFIIRCVISVLALNTMKILSILL